MASKKKYGLINGVLRNSIGGPDMPGKMDMPVDKTPHSKRKKFAKNLMALKKKKM